MRDLNFEVDGQSLRKVGDFSGIIRVALYGKIVLLDMS